MKKLVATSIALGLSVTAANFFKNFNKEYTDYTARRSTSSRKPYKWIKIK